MTLFKYHGYFYFAKTGDLKEARRLMNQWVDSTGRFNVKKAEVALEHFDERDLILEQLQMSFIIVDLFIWERIDPWNEFLSVLGQAPDGSPHKMLRNTDLAIDKIRDVFFDNIKKEKLDEHHKRIMTSIQQLTDNYVRLQPIELVIDAGLTPQQFFIEWVS